MREIHHPIFLASRDCTQNIFWRKVFENLAYRDAPRGIYFKDQTLYSVTKKKEFNYSFAEKSSEVIYNDIYDLFTRVYGLKSKSDMTKKKELFDQFTQTNSTRRSEDTWNRIKKKSLKENLIQDYVIECEKIYDLPKDQTQKLYFYISVGLVFKVFTAADIHMKGGAISSVDGIDLEDGNVYITRHFKEPRIKKQTLSGVYLYDLWDAHIQSI